MEAIPGIGRTAARVIIAEVDTDMTRFPTSAHPASWGGSPLASRSPPAGPRQRRHRLRQPLPRPGLRRSRDRRLPHQHLPQREIPLARPQARKKALVAVGRSILAIVWNFLADGHTTFVDLGPDHYDTRAGTQRAICHHVRAMYAFGYQVTLSAVA